MTDRYNNYRRSSDSLFNSRMMILMVVMLLFGVCLGAPINLGRITGHGENWTKNSGLYKIYPTDSGVNVSLENKSLLYADLSGYAGDNISWDDGDKHFDVTASGTSKWNIIDNMLYPKVSNAKAQFNNTLGVEGRMFCNSTVVIGEGVDEGHLYFGSNLEKIIESSGNELSITTDDDDDTCAIQNWNTLAIDVNRIQGTGSSWVFFNAGANKITIDVDDGIDFIGNLDMNDYDISEVDVVSASAYYGDIGNCTNVSNRFDQELNTDDDVTFDNSTATQFNVVGVTHTWNIYVNATGVLVWERETV